MPSRDPGYPQGHKREVAGSAHRGASIELSYAFVGARAHERASIAKEAHSRALSIGTVGGE